MDSGYSGTSSPASSSSSSGMIGSPSSQTSDSAYNNNFQNLLISDNVLMTEVRYDGVDIFSIQYEQTPQQQQFPNNKCYLEITEQPVDKFRFRYKSEMHGTHGSLMGISNCKTRKTHPTIELRGYNGKALIRCSLYQTDTLNPVPHSHQLVVRQNDNDITDPHELEVNPDKGYRALFIGMGIIHTAKKFIAEALYEKKTKIREFELRRPCTVKDKNQLKIDSEKQAKSMNLNQVRLCFEAYKIHDDGKTLEQLCKPVFSHPINNMKSALTGELKISRLSACVSSAGGGDDLFLLVEKVGKKNIKVKFFENNDEDECIWEDWGVFTEADVHHQYAIALRTPPYRNKDIDKHVEVFIQLFRPSDGDQSEPVPFKYKPRDFLSSRKRARTCSSSLSSMELPESIAKNNYKDDTSGTTISEEFKKDALLSSLCNLQSSDLQFSEHIKKNSDELMKIFDPSVFDGNLVYDGSKIVLDGAGNKDDKTDEKITSSIHSILRKSNNNIRDAIRLILKFFNDANTNDNDILHNIIQSNEIGEAMKLLKIIDKLQIYTILQLQNKYGDTCLHVACTYDRPAYIKPLINLGIDPNIQNAEGNTALHIAVKESMSMCVTKILEKQNYTKLSKSLNIDLANDNGLTPLHLAVFKNNLEMVKKLLENGNASVKISISKDGNNVLHLAVIQNNEEIVQYLLNNTSVKINQPNTSGFTPLSLAQSMGKDAGKIVQLLLGKGAMNNNDHKFKVELKKLTNIRDDDSNSTSSDSDDEKSLRIDESQCEKMDLNESEIDYIDEIAMKKLSEILKTNQKWKILARTLNLDKYLFLWKSPENMLKHLNTSNIKIQDVVKALKECKEYAAIKCIEEMKSRYQN